MLAGVKGDPRVTVHEGRADEVLAKLAGVSQKTMWWAMKLHDEADEGLLADLRSGKITIKPAYNKLVGKKKEKPASPEQVEAGIDAPEAVKPEAIKPTKVDGEIIQSMGSKDGYTMHSGGGLEDTPDSADAILFEIETALNSFELSVQDALERYTHGMASEGVNTEILSMLKKTTKNTVAYATKYLKEVLKNE